MIPRYEHPTTAQIFSDESKLLGWQQVELAVIQARVGLGLTKQSVLDRIQQALADNPPDVEYWKKEDERLKHDLNAFISERRRFIPSELQHEFHRDMTSYDTEEAAFALQLLSASHLVNDQLEQFDVALRNLALKYRYTVMLARTHGQWAKLRSFGSRVLTWRQEFAAPRALFQFSSALCQQSRISGAVGNYGGNLTPDIEREALTLLRLEPFYGATQIMPRTVYAGLAQSLTLICYVVNKIATDIRLGARSGITLYQEPFGKSQMGSSAMPHKKNTITTEQMGGMVRLADGYVQAIVRNCDTWEERAIEQSCVERVAWPDLFHVTLRMLTAMERIVRELVVYPDRMLEEVVASRGTYATDEAKNFLADELGKRGIPAETAYRIIQLASFNVFEPSQTGRDLRDALFTKETDLAAVLGRVKGGNFYLNTSGTIEERIAKGALYPSPELQASTDDVREWNQLLTDIFKEPRVQIAWHQVFNPKTLLAQEDYLFEKLT